MDSCSILGLRQEMLASAEEAALLILQECWEVRGCPTEPSELATVLKNTLDRCKAKGITYPRCFLLRKGQLARGEWKPNLPAAQPQPGFACIRDWHGTRWHVPYAGGPATPCDCKGKKP